MPLLLTAGTCLLSHSNRFALQSLQLFLYAEYVLLHLEDLPGVDLLLVGLWLLLYQLRHRVDQRRDLGVGLDRALGDNRLAVKAGESRLVVDVGVRPNAFTC